MNKKLMHSVISLFFLLLLHNLIFFHTTPEIISFFIFIDTSKMNFSHLPAEHTEYQIEHKERPPYN